MRDARRCILLLPGTRVIVSLSLSLKSKERERERERERDTHTRARPPLIVSQFEIVDVNGTKQDFVYPGAIENMAQLYDTYARVLVPASSSSTLSKNAPLSPLHPSSAETDPRVPLRAHFPATTL